MHGGTSLVDHDNEKPQISGLHSVPTIKRAGYLCCPSIMFSYIKLSGACSGHLYGLRKQLYMQIRTGC